MNEDETIRQNAALDVFLERKADGSYIVLASGRVADLTPTRVLALAEEVYREQCDQRAAPARERLMRETAYRDAVALRADSAGRAASDSRRPGGRGGRGGV